MDGWRPATPVPVATWPGARSATTRPGSLDLDAMPWRAVVPGLRAGARAEVPELTTPGAVPPGARFVRVSSRLAGGPRAVARQEAARAASPIRRGEPRRPLAPAAPRGRAPRARPTSSSARSSRSGEGIFPEELVARVQALPRPGAARAVRRRPRASSRPTSAARSRRCSRGSTAEPLAAASIAQVHARHAAHRRGRRGEGAAPVGRHARPQGPAGHGVARAASSSGASRSPRWPTRRRSSSCSPRRSPRSSTSASRPQNMLDIARVARRPRPARLRRSPAPTPTLVTRRVLVMERLDGLQLRRRGRHAGRRRRHRGRRPHRDDRLHGGRHDPRHLPRRPARRQPVRAARRPHGAARLRHRRPPRPSRGGWPSSGSCSAPRRTTSTASSPPSATSARCPPDTDLDAVIPDLGLDQAAGRPDHARPPTSWSTRSSRSSRRCSATAPACRRS